MVYQKVKCWDWPHCFGRTNSFFMVSVCLETLSNGNYTKGKEEEIGGVPGNRCIIIKTGSRILTALRHLQIICRLVRSEISLVCAPPSLGGWWNKIWRYCISSSLATTSLPNFPPFSVPLNQWHSSSQGVCTEWNAIVEQDTKEQ